jgi:YD repeat-containing protein
MTTELATARWHVVSKSVGGKTTTTDHDGCGRVVSVTDPAGRTVRYEYDAFGRVEKETHDKSGAEIKRTETEYDSLSRPKSTLQSPAGVRTTYSYATAASTVSAATIERVGLTTEILYDKFGREKEHTVVGEGVALDGEVTARDAEGRRTAWEIGGLAAGATYDAAVLVRERCAYDGLRERRARTAHLPDDRRGYHHLRLGQREQTRLLVARG